MSEIIKSTFRNVFKVGRFLINHQVLKSETGARFSNPSEEKKYLNFQIQGF